MTLTLVLAESSVELVPNEIVHHSSVTANAVKKRKAPQQLILDQNYHHAAILKLGPSGTGRGRPDIAHICLLTALGSPLNIDGKLRCFVHTRDNHMITIDPDARLPRSTERFTSLLEQLYQDSRVPSTGKPLMSLKKQSLSELLSQIESDTVIGLTTRGVAHPMELVAKELADARNPVLLVGGFPVGHFLVQTAKLTTGEYRIDWHRLEAATVVGRAVYDYEKAINLARFQKPALM